MTRESDPSEVQTLFALSGSNRGHLTQPEWDTLLANLPPGEAVVLPITAEAWGEIRRVRLRPRLTPHVRHLAKYIDIPVQESRAFVFWRDGVPTHRRARTLRDFVAVLEQASEAGMAEHLHRGDFSRWVIGVFGDYPLGNTIRHLEDEYRRGNLRDAGNALARAVRARYDFLEPLSGQGR